MSNFCFPTVIILDDTTVVSNGIPGTGNFLGVENGKLKRMSASTSPAPVGTPPTPPTPPAPVGTPPAPVGTPPAPVGAPSPAPAPSQILPYGRPPELYDRLAFQEEWDGTALDTSRWNTSTWYESDPGLDNYQIGGGSLKMWAKKTAEFTFIPHNRTLDTDGKFYQRYGYFEVEAKLPRGLGLWPAFWLMQHDTEERPELVVMQAYCGGGWENWWATDDHRPVNYAASTRAPTGELMDERRLLTEFPTLQQQYYAGQAAALDLSAGFHKYGMHWDSTGAQFFFDGMPVGSKIPSGVHNKRMYIIVDLWVGSDVNPTAGYPDQTTPQTGSAYPFEVRYVRSWSLADGTTQIEGTVPPPGL